MSKPVDVLTSLATIGSFGNIIYLSKRPSLRQIELLAMDQSVRWEFLAQLAVYSRDKYDRKNVPALLCAILTSGFTDHHDQITRIIPRKLLKNIFHRVIDNGDMLRAYFKYVRSVHRTNMNRDAKRTGFGTAPKKLIANWFNSRSPDEIFNESTGNPSMHTILRHAHPKPLDVNHASLYRWLCGQSGTNHLPQQIKLFEQWKMGLVDVPMVPLERLSYRQLSGEEWLTLIREANWLWLLKNFHRIKRSGALSQSEACTLVAARLSDRQSILESRVLPYQILTILEKNSHIPKRIRQALFDATEIAIGNLPALPRTYFLVNPDIARTRSNKTAALMFCSIMRKSWHSTTNLVGLNGNRGLEDIAASIRLAVNSVLPPDQMLKNLNDAKEEGRLVVICSHSQSWSEVLNSDSLLQQEWQRWTTRNPFAKMVCLDLMPIKVPRVQIQNNILCLGGYSDTVFALINDFIGDIIRPEKVAKIIETIQI